MMMFAGIATQISSLVWKTFGYLIYVYTGSDYGFFHLIYLFMHSISESLVIGLIILIGYGWTINYNNIQDSDLYVPISKLIVINVVACVAFMNAVLTLLTKIQSGIHDRHHMFDNITGYVIIGFRLLLLIIFMGGAINTYYKSSEKVKKFFAIFILFGGIYVAALPFIVIIGNTMVKAKDRH
jgi:hypothetical protein